MCIESLLKDTDFLESSKYNVLGLPQATIFNVKLIEFEEEESYEFWYKVVLGEVIFIATVFILPLTYLVLIQTVNVYKNTTTA